MNEPLIECVPNFSEGRDAARVDLLVSAISSVAGVQVLDRTSDRDHHRSVVTFVGPGKAVVEASVRAAAQAAAVIDLTRHSGVHPRVGALDVLPFVPLGSVTLEACADFAHRAGERIARELGIPVYFYGAAALKPGRAALENIRRGQFEGLREAVLTDPARAPDLGGPALHPTAGAVVVGARQVLIAFNINLKSNDVSVARSIARAIRESSGGFRAVKALGLQLASRGLVQVSMNLTDFERTPPHLVFERVSRLAAERGIEVEGSELIGLVPQSAVEMAFAHFMKLPGFGLRSIIENRAQRSRFDTIPVPGPFLAGEKAG